MTRVPLSIALDHPSFPGHFPGRPILPGVVLLDCGLRAIIAAHRASDTGRWRIASAKFLSFVEPGDPLHVEFDAAKSADRFQLRVLAGPAATERLAMTAQVAVTFPEGAR